MLKVRTLGTILDIVWHYNIIFCLITSILYYTGNHNLEESEAHNDSHPLKESKDIVGEESDLLADINYQKQLSTIAE